MPAIVPILYIPHTSKYDDYKQHSSQGNLVTFNAFSQWKSVRKVSYGSRVFYQGSNDNRTWYEIVIF